MLPVTAGPLRVQHEATLSLVIAGVEVEENISGFLLVRLLVAAEIYLNLAIALSFVVEEYGGADSELVDFYFLKFLKF